MGNNTPIRPLSLPSIPVMGLELAFDQEKSSTPHQAVTFPQDDSTTAASSLHSNSSEDLSTSLFRRSDSQLLQRRHPVRVQSPTPSITTRPTTVSCCADLLYQTRAFQLPPQAKTVLESWTITFYAPTSRISSWFSVFGFGLNCLTRHDVEEGRVLSVVPNPHFSQDELSSTLATEKSLFTARTGRPPSLHASEVEARLRALDWKVQDEIYDLLNDRVQSSSNSFRRREWKVVVLVEVEGGEMTDASSSPREEVVARRRGLLRDGMIGKRLRKSKQKRPRMPLTEYRLILRGTETRTSDAGWGQYNRYSRPWRATDEKELGVKRRWSMMTRASEKYVDF
ncbi:hypothetical protein QBC35DRAFT_463518 [Podospora australis]|uniref:Uncharacterized protein n=1 Tax=Podospora australis TaxID=1536484 RepID=A0AAN7AJ14_9PEZI|nr:hypothetical protein QBC35DRAFT_463518 [Podospora australis]